MQQELTGLLDPFCVDVIKQDLPAFKIHLVKFESKLLVFERLCSNLHNRMLQRKKLLFDKWQEQEKIKGLKDKLKLDIHNMRHLEYWAAKANKFWVRGKREIMVIGSKRYRLTAKIYRRMMAASNEYNSFAQFKREIR